MLPKPSNEYDPAGQGEQDVVVPEPKVEYDPDGQGPLQSEVVSLLPNPYLPALHCPAHLLLFLCINKFDPYRPGGQLEHTEEPFVEYLPLAHSVQRDAPLSENFPGSHGAHVDEVAPPAL